MIRYSLKCTNGHSFDSWFQSADAFDGLSRSGLLECPDCGVTKVQKALMAPRVATKDSETPRPQTQPTDTGSDGPTSGDATPVDAPSSASSATAAMPAPNSEAVERLRAEVEKNSDYVGRRFANEARAMHTGEQPERAIHGEANAEEARALLQDGIPILPLPFRDRRGTN